jgi:hypothetical protein
MFKIDVCQLSKAIVVDVLKICLSMFKSYCCQLSEDIFVGCSTSSVTQHRRLLNIVGYSISSVTHNRRLLNIVGDSTSFTLSTLEIRRLIKNIQDY